MQLSKEITTIAKITYEKKASGQKEYKDVALLLLYKSYGFNF
ncbi:hypothetical protein [Nostoc sp. UHCC 0252]|nr:hypothetical protein [Nostoc sp. UHCC 0252]MEA5603352.1 hypothetical protein [Nostoc sp. UHCC 0252]